MLEGYFLDGVSGESLMVFKGDPETLFRMISRLAASRDKEIRMLANQLELEWYRREYEKEDTIGTRGLSSEARPKNRKPSKDCR